MNLSAFRERLRGRGAQAAMLLAVLLVAGSVLWPQPQAQTALTQTHASEMEARLGEVLSEMTGAGRVEVVIQYERTEPAQGGWLASQEQTAEAAPPAAVIVVAVLLGLFLRTRLGLAIRATGNNPDMVRSSSINTALTTIVGLCVANAVTALSGCLLAQSQKSVNIDIGIFFKTED